MAETKTTATKTKPAGTTKKTQAKRTATKRPQKAASGSQPKVFMGPSNPRPRIGQSFSVVWRTAGKPGTFISLWVEGPSGNFHYTVPPKGSFRVQPLDPGKFTIILRDAKSEELARSEVTVRT